MTLTYCTLRFWQAIMLTVKAFQRRTVSRQGKFIRLETLSDPVNSPIDLSPFPDKGNSLDWKRTNTPRIFQVKEVSRQGKFIRLETEKSARMARQTPRGFPTREIH